MVSLDNAIAPLQSGARDEICWRRRKRAPSLFQDTNRHVFNMKIIFSVIIALTSALSANAQFHTAPDSIEGVALVILEYTVSDPGGVETPMLNLQLVYAKQVRESVYTTITIAQNSPVTSASGSATTFRYFDREGVEIPKDDVFSFKKRPWKK